MLERLRYYFCSISREHFIVNRRRELLINADPVTTMTTMQMPAERAQNRAISTLETAFERDPAVRWLYPSDLAYRNFFPEFAERFGGKAFEHDTSFQIENSVGVSLWLPPGVQPEEQPLIDLFNESIPEKRRKDVFSIFEQMGQFHPETPHWYLALIGIHPAHQGRGLGSNLLARALQRCDSEGLPAYLESSNPQNIPLYLRHGFGIIGNIQAGDSPRIVPMLRPAKRPIRVQFSN